MKKNSLIRLGFFFCLVIFQAAKSQSLNPADFKQELTRQRGVLIDVRTPEEYKGEHIKNAVNIDLLSPAFKAEIQKLDKAKAYFLYCGIGKRSAQAAAIFKENGFSEVYDLKNGLSEWKSKGYKTVKSDAVKRIIQ